MGKAFILAVGLSGTLPAAVPYPTAAKRTRLVPCSNAPRSTGAIASDPFSTSILAVRQVEGIPINEPYNSNN